MAPRSKQTPRVLLAPSERSPQRAWRGWPYRSIGARLQLSHLLTSLVPLLVVGTILLYASANAEQRTVEEIQLSVTRSLAADLSDHILQAQYRLVNFGLETSLSVAPQQLRAAADEFLARQTPDLLELAIINLEGNEVARVTDPPTLGATFLRNRSRDPVFVAARQGRIQRAIVNNGRGRAVLQLAAPVKNTTGGITGVVIAQLSTQWLERRLMSLPENTGRSAFIIDASGAVLLGQPPNMLEAAPELKQWPASQAALRTIGDAAGGQVTVAAAPLQFDTWSVVVEQPTDAAYTAQRRSTLLLGVMLLATMIAVVLWGVVIARQMTRPILRLRDAVSTLTDGQLGATIAVERNDELGDLAREFNRMSERLAEQQHAIELHNQRLAESQQAIEERNQRLREGLDLARLIQRDLLPQAPPSNTAIRAAAASEAAIEIGGDFYTYVPLPDGRLRLIIGDASGQGVAAALVMALAGSFVEIHARAASSPAALLNLLNADLCPRFTANHMCVALLVAEFNAHTRQLCVANAGMIAPLVATGHECTYIECFGPPLGVVPDATYSEATIDLLPDQAVIFVSDGIIEARNAARDMWGFRRFEQTVCAAHTSDPAAIVAAVLHEIKRHTGNGTPADDMTIIATTPAPNFVQPYEAAFTPHAQPEVEA